MAIAKSLESALSSLSPAPHQDLSTSPHLSWNHSGSFSLDVHCSYITISQILPTPLRPTPSTATQGITGKSRSGHGHPSLCQYHLVVASQLVWNECQSYEVLPDLLPCVPPSASSFALCLCSWHFSLPAHRPQAYWTPKALPQGFLSLLFPLPRFARMASTAFPVHPTWTRQSANKSTTVSLYHFFHSTYRFLTHYDFPYLVYISPVKSSPGWVGIFVLLIIPFLVPYTVTAV